MTGIVLVDALTKTTYRSSEKEMTLESQPFQGGYEDFLQRPSVSDNDPSGPARSSLLEDLVYYWIRERPPTFNPTNPDLLSLAYYPLKIVAAEWVCYVEVLRHRIKQYEYSTEKSEEKTATVCQNSTPISVPCKYGVDDVFRHSISSNMLSNSSTPATNPRLIRRRMMG